MATVRLAKGDLFAVRSAGPVSHVILAIEQFHSKDNSARFGHSGIIINSRGQTFEALTTARVGCLDRYVGQQIMIVRPKRARRENGVIVQHDLPDTVVTLALREIRQQHEGQWYPAWRLALHLVPPLAKYLSVGGRHLVCSELVAKYEWLASHRELPYTGINPDDLADLWSASARYDIIYEGVWNGTRS
jgi:hypothetical protein